MLICTTCTCTYSPPLQSLVSMLCTMGSLCCELVSLGISFGKKIGPNRIGRISGKFGWISDSIRWNFGMWSVKFVSDLTEMYEFRQTLDYFGQIPGPLFRSMYWWIFYRNWGLRPCLCISKDHNIQFCSIQVDHTCQNSFMTILPKTPQCTTRTSYRNKPRTRLRKLLQLLLKGKATVQKKKTANQKVHHQDLARLKLLSSLPPGRAD
jgi:hypothetical protein